MIPRVLLTIVTVCRNAGARLEPTVASIAELARADIEWVVVDGASTDDTVRRAEAWRDRIAGPVRILSEADHGIYDAMNKGLGMAGGEWVLFLNAGDSLADTSALGKLLALEDSELALITGRVRLVDPRDGVINEAGAAFSWAGIARGVVPPHQACLYRQSAAMAAGGYPEHFGLTADTVLTLRVAHRGKIAFAPYLVANYPTDGVSSRFDWRWRVHRDKARAIRAAAPDWVWRRYRWRWPVEALRATASHLLRRCGLLGGWRRIKRAFQAHRGDQPNGL